MVSHLNIDVTPHKNFLLILKYAVAETWRRVWGSEKFFRRPKFLDDDFFGKIFHFHAPKFWWPWFSHWPGFSDFPFLFPDSPYLYSAKCRLWPFFHKKKHCFKKEFLDDTFFTLFARIRQHYFSKYWEDGYMGRPHLKFWGTTPQSPL